ncbi:hypothetical protein TdN_10330 [Thermodesulfovibrio sp. TK110]
MSSGNPLSWVKTARASNLKSLRSVISSLSGISLFKWVWMYLKPLKGFFPTLKSSSEGINIE